MMISSITRSCGNALKVVNVELPLEGSELSKNVATIDQVRNIIWSKTH